MAAPKDKQSLQEVKTPSFESESPPVDVFLSIPQIDSLLAEDIYGVQMMLEEILSLKDPQINLDEAILLDYYVSGFWWAKETQFTSHQLSDFMNLLYTLMENLETKKMSLEDNIIELGRALVGIGQPQAGKNHTSETLSVDQAKDVITYVKQSLFQHYKLYEFMFNCTRDEFVSGTEQVIEVVQGGDSNFPAALEEALAMEMYARLMVPLPPSPTESEEAEESFEQSLEDGEALGVTEEVDPTAGFTLEDVKTALGQVTQEVLGNVQTEINEKLRLQEEAFTGRIDRLKQP